MIKDIIIQHGLPLNQFETATQLYCMAFVDKVSPFLQSDRRAAKFLSSFVNPDRAIVGLKNGKVVAIAGFKMDKRGLFNPQFENFYKEFGLSGIWRMLGLMMVERSEEKNSLLMDGIAVAPQVRGQGVGTLLLEAICDVARQNGKEKVRLDVIDTNERARALYERVGFVAGKSESIGVLAYIFPFSATTRMDKFF